MINFFKTLADLIGRLFGSHAVKPPSPQAPGLPPVASLPTLLPLPPTTNELQAKMPWELEVHDDQISQPAQPQRQTWSEAGYQALDKVWSDIESAHDITRVIPKLGDMTRAQRITTFLAFMAWIAEYECDWNEASHDPDVNGSSLPENLATGLFQLNVGDQAYFQSGTNYSYQQLRTAIPNIIAAVGMMAHQVRETKTIIFKKPLVGRPKWLFWATIYEGGKFDKTAQILNKLANLRFDTLPEQVTKPKPPEMTPQPQSWYPPSLTVKTPRTLPKELENQIDDILMKINPDGLRAAIEAKDGNTIAGLCGDALTAMNVREKTNNNDGFLVELIQKTAGGIRGWAWCMYEQQVDIAYPEKKLGIASRLPATGACDEFRAYVNAHCPDLIIDYKDSVFGAIWVWLHLSGNGHCGNFKRWITKATAANLNEGNTTAGKIGDQIVREGGGAYLTERAVDLDPASNMRLVMCVKPYASPGVA
jgi:hypothetical protein